MTNTIKTQMDELSKYFSEQLAVQYNYLNHKDKSQYFSNIIKNLFYLKYYKKI